MDKMPSDVDRDAEEEVLPMISYPAPGSRCGGNPFHPQDRNEGMVGARFWLVQQKPSKISTATLFNHGQLTLTVTPKLRSTPSAVSRIKTNVKRQGRERKCGGNDEKKDKKEERGDTFPRKQDLSSQDIAVPVRHGEAEAVSSTSEHKN